MATTPKLENQCDYGHTTIHETRLLPTGGGGNTITCHACFIRQNHGVVNQGTVHAWLGLSVYRHRVETLRSLNHQARSDNHLMATYRCTGACAAEAPGHPHQGRLRRLRTRHGITEGQLLSSGRWVLVTDAWIR